MLLHGSELNVRNNTGIDTLGCSTKQQKVELTKGPAPKALARISSKLSMTNKLFARSLL